MTRIVTTPDTIDGHRSYAVLSRDVRQLGLIRYVARTDCDGSASRTGHWALMHATGRIDRFAKRSEACEEAIKTYG